MRIYISLFDGGSYNLIQEFLSPGHNFSQFECKLCSISEGHQDICDMSISCAETLYGVEGVSGFMLEYYTGWIPAMKCLNSL